MFQWTPQNENVTLRATSRPFIFLICHALRKEPITPSHAAACKTVVFIIWHKKWGFILVAVCIQVCSLSIWYTVSSTFHNHNVVQYIFLNTQSNFLHNRLQNKLGNGLWGTHVYWWMLVWASLSLLLSSCNIKDFRQCHTEVLMYCHYVHM